MQPNIVKVLEITKPCLTRSELHKQYRLACLEEIYAGKPILHVVRKGQHVRYMVKR